MEAAAHALRSCAASSPKVSLRHETTVDMTNDTSDVPTKMVPTQVAEPISSENSIHADAALASGATLPLGLPFQMAMGAGRTEFATPQSFNATMPLARPIAPRRYIRWHRDVGLPLSD